MHEGSGDLEDETLSKGNERQRRAGGGTEGDNEYSNGWKEYDGVAEKQRKVRHLTSRCVRGNFDEKDKGEYEEMITRRDELWRGMIK